MITISVGPFYFYVLMFVCVLLYRTEFVPKAEEVVNRVSHHPSAVTEGVSIQLHISLSIYIYSRK